MDFTRLRDINEQRLQESQAQALNDQQELSQIQLQETIVKVAKSIVEFLEGHTSKAIVLNQIQDFATTSDTENVTKSIESLHETLKTHKNVDLSELTGVMNNALTELKKIPKQHQEQKEQKFIDYSKQLDGLAKAVKAVEKSIKDQKTTVEAPNVNVEAPQVVVDAPDLKPLTKEVDKAFTKAIKSIAFPDYRVDTSTIEEEQKKQTKLLKEIRDTPGGGSSGSSSIAPFLVNGALPVNTGGTNPATSTVTSVSGSASSVELLASNTSRSGAYFYNDSSAECYLKLGTTASTTSFTIKMAASSFYELPSPVYTGKIDAIWASATGAIRITEVQ